MNTINHIKTVFSFFFKNSLKSRKTKLFFFLSIIPSIIIIIINIVNKGSSDPAFNNLFEKIGLIYFFVFYIQALALFLGTSIINDEVSDKTLIYLTTKPISKSSILIGKYLAYYINALLIVIIGVLLAFISDYKMGLNLTTIILILGIAAIALLSYMAMFNLFGTVLKRPIMIGLVFVFGWEPLASLIGGTVQKFSYAYYINFLLPGNIYELKSSPSSAFISIIMLLGFAIIFLGISIYTFKKKEYNLST